MALPWSMQSFTMAGIECANAYILPHRGGVGNHRCFILDFMLSSVIGTRFPNFVRFSTRKLHCKSSCLVQSYKAKLDMLCNRHKMYQRIYTSFIPILTASSTMIFYISWIIGTTNLFSSSSTRRLVAQNSRIATSNGAQRWVSGYHVGGSWLVLRYLCWALALPILATWFGIVYAPISLIQDRFPTVTLWYQ